MDIATADMIIYVVGGLIVTALAGTGGAGIRQYFLSRQNGNSQLNVLTGLVEGLQENTKVLTKMDRKMDRDNTRISEEFTNIHKRFKEHDKLESERRAQEKELHAMEKKFEEERYERLFECIEQIKNGQ